MRDMLSWIHQKTSIDPDDAGGFTGFEIRFKVAEVDFGLKMLQCMPSSFIERFKPGRKKM